MMKNVYILSCAKNGGICRYSFSAGRLKFIDKTPLDRPMYAIKRGDKMYVILREIDAATNFGGFLSFDIANDGSLENQSQIVSTNGVCPCHLEVIDGNKYVANYLSGNLVKIGDKSVSHSGSGVHPTRQKTPHTHFVCATPDRDYILCTDLGLDTIFIYDRSLNEKGKAQVPLGSGVRHLCFSEDGKHLYAVNELSNDVCVFEYNGGALRLLATNSALPDFKGESTAAAIRIKGEYLYVSNRGANTISRFKIEGEKLILLENTLCGGKGPRDFDIIDDYIICTNEQSNNISILKLIKGKPELTDIISGICAPLCIIGE